MGRTGVEMEALTATSVALLTIYDMLKAIDRGRVMDGIRLIEKHGGKSGSWVAKKNKKPLFHDVESFIPALNMVDGLNNLRVPCMRFGFT